VIRGLEVKILACVGLDGNPRCLKPGGLERERGSIRVRVGRIKARRMGVRLGVRIECQGVPGDGGRVGPRSSGH
jgi:hypothetical protein